MGEVVVDDLDLVEVHLLELRHLPDYAPRASGAVADPVVHPGAEGAAVGAAPGGDHGGHGGLPGLEVLRPLDVLVEGEEVAGRGWQGVEVLDVDGLGVALGLASVPECNAV
ncbi:hypothetical protein ES703_06795 [subsurface metagenome]